MSGDPPMPDEGPAGPSPTTSPAARSTPRGPDTLPSHHDGLDSLFDHGTGQTQTSPGDEDSVDTGVAESTVDDGADADRDADGPAERTIDDLADFSEHDQPETWSGEYVGDDEDGLPSLPEHGLLRPLTAEEVSRAETRPGIDTPATKPGVEVVAAPHPEVKAFEERLESESSGVDWDAVPPLSARLDEEAAFADTMEATLEDVHDGIEDEELDEQERNEAVMIGLAIGGFGGLAISWMLSEYLW